MENQIDAKEFKAKFKRANEGLFTTEYMMEKYGEYLTESKDIRIAELEKENADLRRAISECKARARIGVSPENR